MKKIEDIEGPIKSFINEIEKNGGINHRYTSFDFCYNYFYNNKGNLVGDNLQESCLQLWAFLASWGMIVRGNELQGKSYVFLIDVIQYINKHPEYYDLTIEDKEYTKKVLNLYKGIDNALRFTKQKNKKTLITKIILGVYACCPAFDSNFCKVFHSSSQGNLTESNLQKIIDFYRDNKEQIDSLKISTQVSPFKGEVKRKSLFYTPAKLIDMYGFQKELEMEKNKEKKK